MKKQIFVFLIILIILPIISASGIVSVNPSNAKNGNYVNITLYPTASGMDCSGIIKSSTNTDVLGFFKFECGSNCRCYTTVSTKFYVKEYMWGDYYASVWDRGKGDFSKGYFHVNTNSCPNGIKDDSESDVDCGGNECNKCSDKRDCTTDSDCVSDYCNLNNKCSSYIGIKNGEKYSEKEIFLISDDNWKNVLKLVSLSTWNENLETIKFPVLIYHEEGDLFDADSSIQFLQLYPLSHLTIFGESPEELDKLLIANKTFGSGLRKENISKVSFNDYYSYWNKINEVVVSENKYEIALMASVFASYKNAPLIFDDEIDYGVLEGRKVYVIGEVDNLSKIKNISNKTETYSLEEIQKKYIELTNTNKAIIVNPNDLGIGLDKNFRTKKSSKIKDIYSKNSLASAFLASAKNEVIMNVLLPESPENRQCEDNKEIINNFNEAKESIHEQITELFNSNPIEYLTIIASPNSIPDSVYNGCHQTGGQYRKSSDSEYANIDNKTLKIGRIYGVSSADSSSYIARDIFYDKISEDIYGNNPTGLSIGHSFEEYSDNAQKQTEASKNSGYESVCYTGEEREGCVRRISVPLKDYSKKQFIIFGNHGYPYKWANTLQSSRVPPLDLSYVFAHACSTNNYWEGQEKLMGASILRNGAISYQGAVGVSYGDNSEGIALQKLTSSNITLGELNKELMLEFSKYKRDYIMLGDPTLQPNFKKIDWSGVNFIYSQERVEGEYSKDNEIRIDFINTIKEDYSPGEDIIIKSKIKNLENLSNQGYLEYNIYSGEGRYVSELKIQKIGLGPDEEKEFNFSMQVIDTMPSGGYKVVVRLLDYWEEEIDKKEISFNVSGAKEELDILLKSCEDKDCEKENHIFNKNEIIYLDYEVLEDLKINAILEFPDGTKKNILLPNEVSPDKIGVYTLIINITKPGYVDYEDEINFIIEENPNISIEEICNANQVCDEKENNQNCPQDCNSIKILKENETGKGNNTEEDVAEENTIEDNADEENKTQENMTEDDKKEIRRQTHYINSFDETEKESETLNTKIIDLNKVTAYDLRQANEEKLYKPIEKTNPILWVIIFFFLVYIILVIVMMIARR